MGEPVRLSTAEPGAPAILFAEPFRPFDDDVLDLHVRMTGTGLDAAAWVRTVAGDGLVGFLRDLERDFRGWPGTRSWRSLEGDLTVDARHSGGRVRLDVRLAPAAGWEVAMNVLVAPGEELSRLAARIAALLDGRPEA